MIHLKGAQGPEAWRWLFIIEGVPSGEDSSDIFAAPSNSLKWLLVFSSFLFLPSYPKEASWLTPEEKDVETRRLGTTASSKYKEPLQ